MSCPAVHPTYYYRGFLGMKRKKKNTAPQYWTEKNDVPVAKFTKETSLHVSACAKVSRYLVVFMHIELHTCWGWKEFSLTSCLRRRTGLWRRAGFLRRAFKSPWLNNAVCSGSNFPKALQHNDQVHSIQYSFTWKALLTMDSFTEMHSLDDA